VEYFFMILFKNDHIYDNIIKNDFSRVANGIINIIGLVAEPVAAFHPGPICVGLCTKDCNQKCIKKGYTKGGACTGMSPSDRLECCCNN
jgi:hypothetical protein